MTKEKDSLTPRGKTLWGCLGRSPVSPCRSWFPCVQSSIEPVQRAISVVRRVYVNVTHRVGGGLVQAPVQNPTEDGTGKNVADAQYERYVADDLPGTSVGLVFINALDGEKANISAQDDG